MKKLSFKRLLKKRNNGGFTLLEVIVSCALLSILVLGVMGFIGPVMSIVRVNEKNAHATMLAETINSYINGCLKNAVMVQVFTNTKQNVASNPDKTGGLKGKTGNDAGLNKINTFLNSEDTNGVKNSKKYEVRCIGVCFEPDSTTPGRKKLVLTTCPVSKAISGSDFDLNIYPSTPFFDDVLYNGLYPVVNITNFSATKDADGNYTGDNERGYKVETEVYTDQKCYSTSSVERDKSHLAFTGASYVNCVNMTGPADNVNTVSELQSAIDARGSGDEYTVGDQTFYYPNTYIYYLVASDKPIAP